MCPGAGPYLSPPLLPSPIKGEGKNSRCGNEPYAALSSAPHWRGNELCAALGEQGAQGLDTRRRIGISANANAERVLHEWATEVPHQDTAFFQGLEHFCSPTIGNAGEDKIAA